MVENALKTLRKRSGLTQQQLADKSGVSVWALRKWEQHGTASAYAGMLKLVAEALGCKVDDLV